MTTDARSLGARWRWPLLAAAIGALLWAWSSWRGDAVAPAPLANPPQGVPAGADVVADETAAPQRVATAAAGETPEPFRSVDGDGEPIAAVPDGLTMLVRDTTGAPVAGAEVEVGWCRGGNEFSFGKDLGTTDAAGRFRTSVRRVEQLDGLRVAAPGLGWLQFDGEPIVAAAASDTVVLVVPAGAALTVKVVDDGGNAIEAAAVTVVGVPVPGGPFENLLRSAGTAVDSDPNGLARLDVPAGVCTISATARGHTSRYSLRCDLPAGPTQLSLQLLDNRRMRLVTVHVHRPPGVRGTVSLRGDTSEMPAMAASPLVVAAEVDRRRLTSWGQPLTDDFKVFVERVRWRLRIEVDGCADYQQWVDAATDVVDVQLQTVDPAKVLRVHGRVLDARGEAVAHTEVVWHCQDHLDGWRHVLADEQGRYAIEGPAGEPFVLSAWRSGHAPAWREQLDGAVGSLAVDLRLGAAGTVRGRCVDDDGAPLRGAVVLRTVGGPLERLAARLGQAGSQEAEALRGMQQVALDGGEFRFEEVGGGDYELVTVPDDLLWPARRRVRAGEVVELRCGEGLEGLARIECQVVDPGTRLPIAGVSSSIGEVGDARGRLRLCVPPGDLQFVMQADGRARKTQRLRGVPAGLSRFVLELPRSVPRFVLVLGADGRPLADCEVRVLDAEAVATGDASPYWPLIGETLSAANGRVDLIGLPAGAFRLAVQRRERNTRGWLLAGPTREFDLAEGSGVREVAVLRW
ncbi:MAG: hypothetical protein H6838_18770 [Planctomycetes bacterium]|nr:hypothetical protein [Planctomycetota bacterium]